MEQNNTDCLTKSCTVSFPKISLKFQTHRMTGVPHLLKTDFSSPSQIGSDLAKIGVSKEWRVPHIRHILGFPSHNFSQTLIRTSDPARFCRFLYKRCIDFGVQFALNSNVTSVEVDDDAQQFSSVNIQEVACASRKVPFPNVVVAAGHGPTMCSPPCSRVQT